MTNVKFWDWDKIMALDIGEVSFSIKYFSPLPNIFGAAGELQPQFRVPVVRLQRRPGPGAAVPPELGLQAVRGYLLDQNQCQVDCQIYNYYLYYTQGDQLMSDPKKYFV